MRVGVATFAVLGPVLLTGCAGRFLVPVSTLSDSRIQRTHDVIYQRRHEALNYSLAEKAAVFEAGLNNGFLLADNRLAARELYPTVPASGDLETSSLLLATAAFKHASTDGNDALELARRLVRGLRALDAANGWDGYIPRRATVGEHGLDVVVNRTYANAYSQLMFGYICAFIHIDDATIRASIRDHIRIITHRLLQSGLHVIDNHGQPMPNSNMLSSISRSRQLDALVMLECSRYILDERDSLQTPLGTVLHELERRRYFDKIQLLHIRVLNMQLPSHATDWLNFIRLYTLIQTNDRPEYVNSLARLYDSQKRENNPLFNIIYASQYSDNGHIRRRVNRYMRTFPITLNNTEIIGSTVPGIRRRLLPVFTKMHTQPEATRPPPIWQRPLSANEWKRNPYRLDGNLSGDGTVQFAGIDFLLAYWMGVYHGLISRPETAVNNAATVGTPG